MKRIIIQILSVFIPFCGILGLLWILAIVDKEFVDSALLSGLINLVNFSSASAVFAVFHNKSDKKFIKYVLGGMVVRMLLLLAVVFIILKFLKIDEYAFIFTFFLIYFVFLCVEIYNFHKKTMKKRDNLY